MTHNAMAASIWWVARRVAVFPFGAHWTPQAPSAGGTRAPEHISKPLLAFPVLPIFAIGRTILISRPTGLQPLRTISMSTWALMMALIALTIGSEAKSRFPLLASYQWRNQQPACDHVVY